MMGLTFASMLFMASCYSPYLTFNIMFSDRCAYNDDNSSFAFVAMMSLYRRPVGLARFPDGGTPSYEYGDSALYYYSNSDKSVHKALDLSYLRPVYDSLILGYTDLVFKGSTIYYKLHEPLKSSIKHAKEMAKTQEDMERIQSIIDASSRAMAYSIKTGTVVPFDNTAFEKMLLSAKKKSSEKSWREILKKVPLHQWGIDLRKIFPQPVKTYMEYIIYQKGDEKVREAILEDIIPELPKDDIRGLLSKMDKYKKKLDKKFKTSLDYKERDIWKRYMPYYEKTYPEIKRLLQIKRQRSNIQIIQTEVFAHEKMDKSLPDNPGCRDVCMQWEIG